MGADPCPSILSKKKLRTMQENGSPEPVERQLILRITINPDAPVGQFQRAVMRSVDLAAFGLTAAAGTKLTEPPRLPEVFLQVQLGQRLPIENLPGEFHAWILASSLRDMIEALEPLLEEMWKVLWALELQNGVPMRPDQFNAVLQDFHRVPEDFQRLAGVGKKLSKILETYPGLLSEKWVAAIRSIIALRNCMVHRRGIVGSKDCTADGVMTVTWQEWRALIQCPDGSSEPAVSGIVPREDGVMCLRRSFEQKSFRQGDRVQFEIQDLVDVALTLYSAAMQMREGYLQLLRSRGIEIQPPPPPNETTGPE